MKNEEAKFILGAYRPDGRDAGDATFGPALAQAENDPELHAWFEAQRKFDAAVAAKLNDIAPPAGLHDAILTGSRVSVSAAHPRRSWWKNPAWLAAAAAIVIIGVVGIRIQPDANLPSGADLAAFALRDLANAHGDHVGHPPALADVQTRLASARLPITKSFNVSLAELRQRNCRTVQVGGRDVFEVCFRREGTWYHVYIGRREDFRGTLDPKALMNVQGQFASTAWADANHVYALVTRAGAEALRRVI